MNNNFTIAQQAHKQIKAYRDLMRDPATGFWRHVTHNGQWEGTFYILHARLSLGAFSFFVSIEPHLTCSVCVDANHWGTGMGWVAAGMTR